MFRYYKGSSSKTALQQRETRLCLAHMPKWDLSNALGKDTCTAQRSEIYRLKRQLENNPTSKPVPCHLKGNSSCTNSPTQNWNFSLRYYMWQTQQIEQVWASELLRDFKSKYTLFNKERHPLPSRLWSPSSQMFLSCFKRFFLTFCALGPARRLDLGNPNVQCRVCLRWHIFGWTFGLCFHSTVKEPQLF